jgi:hypothetical protein
LFNQYGGQNEDSFGFISSNMLIVGAKLYSIDPNLFNLFENENYIKTYLAYLCGPISMDKPHLKDIALDCLYFIFSQKEHCLVKYLV